MTADLNTRTRLLIGTAGCRALAQCHVSIFGLGGVGSFAAEALARAGVGRLTLTDFSELHPSNLNRQLYALHSTLSSLKTEVARQRIHDINPACIVETRNILAAEDAMAGLLSPPPDVLIDAIDGLAPKTSLLSHAVHGSIPVISSMGAGGRLDPRAVRVGDLSETRTCPLARRLRKTLHKAGIREGITCIYSLEPVSVPGPEAIAAARKADPGQPGRGRERQPVGSISYLPGIFGLTAAGEAIRLILSRNEGMQNA